MRLNLFVSLVLCAPASVHCQNTWTVGPGQQFAEIQPAIDAASNGDLILVSRALYNATGTQPVWVNKPLRILCEGQALISNGVRFSGIGKGEQAVLCNAQIVGGEVQGVRTLVVLEILDCEGVVSVSGCGLYAGATRDLQGRLIYVSDPVVRSLRSNLLLANTYVHGGYGAPVITASDSRLFLSFVHGLQGRPPFIIDGGGYRLFLGDVAPAISVSQSFLSMADTSVVGGTSEDATYSKGGDAIVAQGGELHLAVGRALGGLGFANPSGPGGNGGSGLVHNSKVFASVLATVAGGAGGSGTPPGTPGPAVVGTPPVIVPLPGISCVQSVVQRGSAMRFTSRLAAGSFHYWGFTQGAAISEVFGLTGFLVLRMDQPHFVTGPSVVPPSGSVTLSLPVPLDPALVGTVVFVQCGGLDPSTSQAFLSPGLQCIVE